MKGDYDLIISNPVQFQASLNNLHGQNLNAKNSETKAIRDKVWKEIFSRERDDFHNRLNSYEPIIINACTANLKATITEAVVHWKKRGKADLYIANKHPCVWSEKTKLEKCE